MILFIVAIKIVDIYILCLVLSALKFERLVLNGTQSRDRKRRSGLSDAAIYVLLDVDDLGNSNISGVSEDSDADFSYRPETEDVDPKSSDKNKLVEVQSVWGEHPEQDAAGDHGPGHQPQLQTELSSDEDGGGEPSKSAKIEGYLMANR